MHNNLPKCNGLKASTKRQGLAEWIKKNKTHIDAVYKKPTVCIYRHIQAIRKPLYISRETYRMKVRRWKKVLYADGNQTKAGVAVLRQNRI